MLNPSCKVQAQHLQMSCHNIYKCHGRLMTVFFKTLVTLYSKNFVGHPWKMFLNGKMKFNHFNCVGMHCLHKEEIQFVVRQIKAAMFNPLVVIPNCHGMLWKHKKIP